MAEGVQYIRDRGLTDIARERRGRESKGEELHVYRYEGLSSDDVAR